MLGSTAALIVVAAPVPDSDQRIRGPCAVTKCLAGISLALVGSETSVGGGGVLHGNPTWSLPQEPWLECGGDTTFHAGKCSWGGVQYRRP